MSYKKLQDLLNAGSQNGRDYQTLPSQLQRSPLIPQTQMSPLGQNFSIKNPSFSSSLILEVDAKATRSPSYQSFPGVQNIFYHPMTKGQMDQVCPSPMFQIPQSKDPQVFNSIFQGSRYTAAETNPSSNPSNLDRNNFSNSLGQHFNSLQREAPNQPKNLEELLQRSFTSIPSNSLQSPFTSSVQSPFMGGNNHTSQIQPSINSELSNLLTPMTLLETSLQNNNLIGGLAKNQSNDSAVSKELILQVAKLLKEESETKIKSAIAELILKFKALGAIGNILDGEMFGLESLINAADAQQNHTAYQQYQPNPQIPQQNTVPLSCGLAMNSIPRNDFNQQQPLRNMYNFNSNPQPVQIDAARRELINMSEPQHQPTTLFSNQIHHHQEHYAPNQYSFNSPINNLGQEMDSLNLNVNLHHQNQQYTHFLGQNVILHPEKIDDLGNDHDLGSILKQQVPSDEELPGIYNKHERINKILKYKNKIRKWRNQHPVKRVFKGRSQVAGQKPRIKGKFVTIEEYHSHSYKPISSNCKKEFILGAKEEDI